MNADLLIEILSEELPALPFLKEEKKILEKWQNILEEYQIKADFEFFYTPRRMVLISRNFPLKQENQKLEFFGPPVEIAYINGNKEEGLSKAGESFLKKCNLTSEQASSAIQTLQKEGKEILYFSQMMQGKETKESLGEMIEKWLKSLQFGKSMRWGSLKDSFIRPIRHIAVLLGEENIQVRLFGITSSLSTLVHRDLGFEERKFGSLEEYLNLLEKGGVILDPKKRKETILQQIDAIQKQKQVNVELDLALLDEIVTITEYPRAVFGEFDAEFLSLPQEVIITSMKENQRYFALYQNDKLYNGFIVIINSMSEELKMIKQGNEKVLKARLSDAMFFYRNDLKKPLESYDLSQIAFVDGLGSMQDKVRRESAIVGYLSQNDASALQAVQISKSDLLSEMVGEFPELQGVMGSYYALAEIKNGNPKYNAEIALALKEQYFPNGEDAPIPSSRLGAYLALGYRLDALMALLSIGKIPSGSKDPYALRRAGNAILRILQVYEIALSLEDLKNLAIHYQEFDVTKVWEFLLERIEGVLGISATIVRSVRLGRERDLRVMMQKCLALNSVFEEADKEAFISIFKRVANITKDAKQTPISKELFQTPQEERLFARIQEIAQTEFLEVREYLQALFGLQGVLEEFFESVMVNVEDQALRDNRKALIYEIYLMFLEIGDIKEITN